VSDSAVEPHGTRKLVILMISAFVDMLGMLMILPLLPFYAEKLGAGGAIVGLLVASFSIASCSALRTGGASPIGTVGGRRCW
jgi:MFS family permease